MSQSNPETLREEFNRWAAAGRGEGMEQEHLPITLPILGKMRLGTADNVLDVGCGAGWLSRRLAKLVPLGRVVGIDVSDEMIRHARRASVDFENLMFVTGEVEEIPWEPNFFRRSRRNSLGAEFLHSCDFCRIVVLLARSRRRHPRHFSRAKARWFGVDSHQLLPRQSPLPPVGRLDPSKNAFALGRGLERIFPRRRFRKSAVRTYCRSFANAGDLHGPVVS